MSIPDPSGIIDTLEKFPEESRVYGFDFADFSEVAAGAKLIAPVIALPDTDGNLVVGSATVSETDVLVQISGGTPGRTYLVQCDVSTDAAPPAVIADYVKVLILDPSLL